MKAAALMQLKRFFHVFVLGPKPMTRPIDHAPDGRLLSGCIPFRPYPASTNDGQRFEVCLISSRRHPDKLVFPKGGVEAGETTEEAACRETWEEAGIRGGLLLPAFGEDSGCTWYMMRVGEEAEEWPEMGFRRRFWLVAGEELQERSDLGGTTRKVLELVLPKLNSMKI